MNGQSDNADTKCKKLHPFFSTNNNSKDGMLNVTTPVTPDPSCSPNSVDAADTADTADTADNDADQSPPSSMLKRKLGETSDAQDTSMLASTSKPSKVLKLNRATGTIGSPPKPKPTTKKTSKRGRKPKTFLVSICYGKEDDNSRFQIGNKIHQLLTSPNSQAMIATAPKDNTSILPETPPSSRDVEAAPKKPTHPFFQGKTKTTTIEAVEEKQKPQRRVFFSSANSSKNTRPASGRFDLPAPGVKSNTLKIPGAQHPAWPSKETAHVRGDVSHHFSNPSPADEEQCLCLQNKRKAKGQQVQIPESESILRQTASKLNLKQLKKDMKFYDDEFQPPPPVLRVPTRYFESGKKLQVRVSSELVTFHPRSNTSKTHPALTHAYNSIEKSLSAFDKATCETSAWSQKYAPSSAERVLQSGREAELLRDWLENLKVRAVDSGSKPKIVAPTKAKGKRKKLDGFVVYSDEEGSEYELDEISDTEGDWSQSSGQGNAKKTVIRSGSARQASRDGGRFANAVVLSGPHGCGKTATIYAIAKELDFEIFEINSGSRRNGKDILEKVGDMTRNHLVQHRNKEDVPQEEDALEDEVDRDLKSGKQGMMTAFFKPKTTPAPAPAPTKKPTDSPSFKEAKKSPKAQKQSLILLEEVDVLYEEDKQFWATIISMIAQSKRPFVMTCNDEALVPLQGLNLHGIFRFSSPPKDLAVDLLLLIAANEGHALQRHTIETLYDSRGHDFRASITELNYWCQIGVGDVQGGFNWFYPRWPKGSDVDEDGNVIRVVSQNTYQAGMGWLSRDSAIDSLSSRATEEELHQQVCQNWSLDTLDYRPQDEYSSWAATAAERCSSAKERLELLESVDSYIGFMSDADLGLSDFSAIPNKISMDPTIPSLPAKAKDDFIIGRQLIEVSPAVYYDTTRFDMAASLKHLGRRQLQSRQDIDRVSNIFKPLDETEVTTRLKDHLSGHLDTQPAVARIDYSLAFDPIAASEKTMAAGYLDPSVFDGTMESICIDVAPFVRSIVSYDQRLQKQRVSRSSLLSEGGQVGKKRMRTTRSALSALEGGPRASTRREKYFSASINPYLVMRTGGKGWDGVVASVMDESGVTRKIAANPHVEPGQQDVE
ncbi:P-loop containing nucleoside triphosphate hydrolase protein [Annulohypoxylon maeteangense]|uniref:P-loop containing nucleoside triphosphate hydrolase protein n=1 Tax=Annulohypoxylon maeteangense TaxID=1927788 RepID=UPI0020072B1A|nr:P-loop containing nucleoside triphosphate hydrolase protein [Annulohypoxylon maeteangense]KAI0880737.1 P-loop containing nucleoside triphosphate hydrolase protein [Annulohypoxylon maeteangense]